MHRIQHMDLVGTVHGLATHCFKKFLSYFVFLHKIVNNQRDRENQICTSILDLSGGANAGAGGSWNRALMRTQEWVVASGLPLAQCLQLCTHGPKWFMCHLYRKGTSVLKSPKIKAKQGKRQKEKKNKCVPLRIHKWKRKHSHFSRNY